MDEDARKPCRTPSAELAVRALAEVQDPRPNGEPPTHVPETVVGVVKWENVCISRIDAVADETTCCVRIQPEGEEKGEMVRVPERFEALVAHFSTCSCVDEEHDEKHEVSGDAAGLSVVNLKRGLLANLCLGRWNFCGRR